MYKIIIFYIFSTTIVTWRNFREKLQAVHPIGSSLEAIALKTTIDFTVDNHVSIFEFDVFTRLFAPWRNIIQNWNVNLPIRSILFVLEPPKLTASVLVDPLFITK